ncbi:NADPH oxidase organizer 1 [Liparis tanakae]|uniref:NADPH oxidase organizer 1 n=1 Tax=Liparis tanakae TaxID=230148 RepID=A0A4Z2HKK9_9TELE|nr:NADPH oxidase organizer 1 [Liparis tanakae]
MILPSDEDVAGQVKGGGNVTQPFVTETYRCVAPYETKDTQNKPFKVALDEKVDVLIKDQAGWWLVENEDKKMAWFPAPYLEKLDEDDDDEDENDGNGSLERGAVYTAVKNYKATKDDEITVAIGSAVEVLQKSANGWWFIRYNGKAGYIPSMYLQPYSSPHIRLPGNHQDRRLSSSNQIAPPTLHSNQLSLSQGNLSQLPPSRSASPNLLRMPRQQRSHSMDTSSEKHPYLLTPRTAAPAAATSPVTPPKYGPPPVIMVEMDGEEEQRDARPDSDESFLSDSDGSDDLNSSWGSSSSFNLSKSYSGEQLRAGRTPPPTWGNQLSPASISEGRMAPSVSEPNLYKGPTAPKVPPRPQAQEILTRCSTVTRKNASKGRTSPSPGDVMSR